MTDPQKKYTRAELAGIIKGKYPEYSDVEDNELIDLVTNKYPEYNDYLLDEPVKKKDDTVYESSMDSSDISQAIKQKVQEDEEQELESYGDRLEAGFKQAGASLARIPQFVREIAMTATTGLQEIITGESELGDYLDSLPREQRDVLVGSLFAGPSIPSTVEVTKASEELYKEAEKLQSSFKRFDTSITEDLKEGELGQAWSRLTREGVGAIPSMLQAFVPGVGIASIGLSSAASKSRELQDKGEDLDLATISNSVITGTAEAASELITKKIGGKLFNSLAGKGKDVVMKTLGTYAKEFGIDFAQEGAGESGSLLVSKLADAILSGDEKAFEGGFYEFADTFLVGGFATGPLSGAKTGVDIATQGVRKRNVQRKVDQSKYVSTIDAFSDRNMGDIDSQQRDIANQKSSREVLEFQLKERQNKGQISSKESKKILDNFDEVTSLDNQIGGLGLSQEAEAKAISLIRERNTIEQTIEGKDPNLVKKQRDRISEINKELEGIQDEDVAVEETTQEVTEEAVEETTQESAEETVDQSVEEETTQEDTTEGTLDYATKTTGVSRVDSSGRFLGVFSKKDGKQVTGKKPVREHQDELIKQRDYTTGKSAFDGIPEGTVSGNPNEIIATDSENPQEIARAYEQEKQSLPTDIDPVVDAFVGMYKVDGKSLKDYYGSKDDLGQVLSYIRGKKGRRGMPLDVIAQEVSGTVGFEVSPQQLFDIMMDPKYKSNRPPTQSDLTISLRNRFIEVTGLNGTDSQIKAVAEQDPSKLQGGVLSKKEQTTEDFKRAKEEQEFMESQQEEQTEPVEKESKTRLESLVADTFLEPVIKRIQDSTRKFYKTHLSAKGYMTEEMNRYREIRNGGFARDLGRVKRSAKQFNRLTKGMTDEQKAQVMEDLNDILHGRVDKKDSPLMSTEKGQKIAEIGQRMRAEIDALSYRLVDTNLLSEESNENVLNNIGTYVNRSYRLFETVDWKDNVKEEVVEAAKVYIKNNLKKLRVEAEKRSGVIDQIKAGKKIGVPVESLLTDKQLQEVDALHDRLVEEEIERILNKSDKSEYKVFIKGASDARAALSRGILEQRNDGIPLEIQDLMGRIDNPLDNYLNTIKKLSILVNNIEFQANLLQMGGAGIFSNKQVGEFTTLVADKKSKTYPHLQGMYARPEIAALFQGKEQGKDMLSQILASNNELLVQIGGTIKGLKTVGSIGTHFKNVLGNLGFVMLNGHVNISEFKKAGSLAYKSIGERFTSEEQTAMMDEYRSLGLIGQSVTLGDVKAMFGQESFEQAMESSLSDPKKSVENKRAKAFSKLLGGVKKKFGGTIETFESAYQAEDDLFKIVAYEVEKSRYSDALFSKDYSQLTEDQKKEVNDTVVEIVKNTYPTYDRVGPLFKKIGKSPFIGAFISFQVESVRTMVNSFRLAQQQLSSENPKVRRLGRYRSAYFLAYGGLQTAITLGLMQAGKTALGFGLKRRDDEDETIEYDDIRKFMPPWSKNSNVSVFETETPGVYNVLDLSSNNPHSLMMSVMKAGTQDSGKSHFVEAVSAAMSPFLGQDMIAATAFQLYSAIENGGITDDGKRIFNPEDSDEVAVSKMAMHVGKLFLPGTATSVMRIGEGVAGVNDRDAANEMLGLIGFRPYKVDIRKQLKFKLYKYKEEINEYKSSYSRSQRKGVDNYDSINESMKSANTEMHELILSATRLGLDANQISSVLKETRIGKSEITQIMTGAAFDYVPRK